MIALVSTFEGVTEAGSKLFHTGGEFIRKNYPEVRAQWWRPMSGKFGPSFIIWWHASLAAKEAFDAKFFADPRWQKIFKDAGPGPLWTSQRDDYYNVVES